MVTINGKQENAAGMTILATVLLEEGDSVEVLRFVGGG